MCLIIDNPNGLQVDPRIIANAIKGNADGWGFMTSRRGRIHITRGMTPGGLDDAIKAHEGIPHVIHFRFATHGTKNLDNCHPFSVLGGQYGAMHNGILSVPRHDVSRSDTWHFCEYVLGPILEAHPDLFGSPYLTSLLETIIGAGNKLVIMRKDGATMVINRKAGCDHDGLWMSNDYSLPEVPRRATATSARSASWHWGEEESSLVEVADDEATDARPARPYAGLADSLTDLADVEYGDLVDFVADHPESVAELIRDFFDYEFS